MRKLSDILAEQDKPDDRDLRSRSDARREQRRSEDALSGLASDLVALTGRRLQQLGLPQEVLDSVLAAKRIRSAIALNRQLRVVRRELRETDAPAIRRRLDAIVRPDGRPSLAHRAVVEWTERLLSDVDPALDELIESHPRADRQRLRQLARNLKAAKAARREAARQSLARALADTFAAARADVRQEEATAAPVQD